MCPLMNKCNEDGFVAAKPHVSSVVMTKSEPFCDVTFSRHMSESVCVVADGPAVTVTPFADAAVSVLGLIDANLD